MHEQILYNQQSNVPQNIYGTQSNMISNNAGPSLGQSYQGMGMGMSNNIGINPQSIPQQNQNLSNSNTSHMMVGGLSSENSSPLNIKTPVMSIGSTDVDLELE